MNAWTRMRDCTIPALLQRLVQERPGQEALVYPFRDLRMTFADVDAATLELARALMAAGVEKGDRVTLWAPNVPEWILLQLGLARIGAILVTANTALKPPEIEYLLNQSRSSMVIYAAGPASNPYPAALAQIRDRLPNLRQEVFLGDEAEGPAITLDQLKAAAAKVNANIIHILENGHEPDEVINMQYTSGTTGFPKGVMLTHRNLMNNAWGLGHELRFAAGERLALTVPLFHCFGCVVGTLGAFNSAATICAIDDFTPAHALELVERERCNVIYGVPTHYRLMLEEQDRTPRDLTSLRTGIMGGAPCPEEMVRRIVTDLHIPQMVAAYGLTECSPGVSTNDPEDSIEMRSTTVGKPLADIEVKVVDPATLEEMPRGERGELWVRGHCVMKGYYDNPEATAEVLMPDGWLRTGDLAIQRPDDYLQIVGRIKEMIIKGGENVYPAEVEDALRDHPAVRDAAVFGVPDPKWGEDVLAAVLLHENTITNEEDLTAHLATRLAGVKIPSRIHVVDAYPMTASGKVQKFRLAEQFGPAD